MFCLLPVGLVYMIVHHSGTGNTAIGLGLTTILLLFLVGIATAVVFYRSFRLAVLHILDIVTRFVIRRSIESSLKSFNSAMALGVAAIAKRPLTIVPVLLLIIVDWAFSLAALWFCFSALGNPIHLGVLITGFAVGVTVGNFSMVPGGLGVQEASMAGVYSLLGVSFESAILAAVLFRVVADFIPFIISLGFYKRLLSTNAT
jgi:uncharacterized protein (TIRG00374 family)